MGFMDKVKAQATVLADKAQTGVQQGQTKLAEMQSGKQVDHLLRDLGAHIFLSERGRAPEDSDSAVAVIVAQLDALEAAGNPVVIASPEPAAAPAVPGAAVPQPGPSVPTSGGPMPAPGSGAPVSEVPPAPPTPPVSSGTIPQSSNRLPGE